MQKLLVKYKVCCHYCDHQMFKKLFVFTVYNNITWS